MKAESHGYQIIFLIGAVIFALCFESFGDELDDQLFVSDFGALSSQHEPVVAEALELIFQRVITTNEPSSEAVSRVLSDFILWKPAL